jgi:hypothetical protein
MPMSSLISSLSETNSFYPDSFSAFSAPPPPFNSQPQQRFLKEITTDAASTSRRSVFNEVQMHLPTTNSTIDAETPINQRSSTGVRPARVSRFSDITPSSAIGETRLETDISVGAQLNDVQISENINCFPGSRRQQNRHNREVMECECTTSEYNRSRGINACGSECLNRMLLIECGPMCTCRQCCTNRRSYASHQ